MHRFEYLAKKFWDIHDWAADLRDDLYALPWPLSYLGYPFDWFRYHMWWVAFNTDRISSWADDVWDRLDDIPTWYNTYWLIRKYFPLLDKTWYDITNYVRDQINRIEVPGVPSYHEIFLHIRSMFVSTYSILSETKDSIISAAIGEMPYTFSILWETTDSIVDRVVSKVKSTFSILSETRDSIVDAAIAKVRSTFPILTWSAQDFLKWMGIDAGDVITTILDTPHDMFMWLQREFERAYSILSETKDSIISAAIGEMPYTFSILWETTDSIVDRVVSKVKSTFSILSETRDTIIDAAVSKMKALFPILTMSAQDVLKWMGIDAGDVITTILDTPHDMFMWLKKEFERAYDVLLHTWSDIHGLILTYLDTLEDWSQDPWDEFVTKVLAALPHIPSIDDVINYVCDRFESILDRLFKEGD